MNGSHYQSSAMLSQTGHFINSAWGSVLEGLSALNGSRCSAHGANIVLCSGNYRVAIHEVLVRRFTNIFHWLPITEDVIDAMRDENDKMVVILPDVQGWSLRVLSDFLYSGRAYFATDEIKEDLDVLLARNIQVSCSREVVPHGVKIWHPEANPIAKDPGHVNPATDVDDEAREDMKYYYEKDYTNHQNYIGHDPDDQDNVDPYEEEDTKPILIHPEVDLVVKGQGRKMKQPKWEDDDEDLPLLPLPKGMKKSVKRNRVSKGEKGMGGDYPHRCTECGWGCVNSFDLVVHMKEHTGKRLWPCPACSHHFTTKKELTSHKKELHPELYQEEVLEKEAKIKATVEARQRGEPWASSKPYPCLQCDKEYSTKDNLTIHMADIHTPDEEKPFPCKNCDKKFPSEKLLKMHQRQEGRKIKGRPKGRPMTRSKPVYCDECNERHPNEKKLQDHIRIAHTGEKPFKCHYCEEHFHSGTLRSKHTTEVHNVIRGIRCKYCGETFESKTLKKEHETTAHVGEEKPFKCRLCGMDFKGQSGLKLHMKKKHPDDIAPRPYKCKDCGEAFALERNLAFHEKKHQEGTGKWPCSVCEERFHFKAELDKHMTTHYGYEAYPCPECPKKFSTELHLKAHIKTHSLMVLLCKHCGKQFNGPRRLRLHEQRYHSGLEKSYQCDLCPKVFFTQTELNSHLNGKHSEVRNHSCDKCGKCFKDIHSLRKHYMVHTGEKPFQCSKCDYQCRFRTMLVIHERKHTGEKPFECSICKMRFKQSGTLRDHMMTHTGEKRYACPVCDYKCIQCTDMTKHLKKHGNIPIDLKSCLIPERKSLHEMTQGQLKKVEV